MNNALKQLSDLDGLTFYVPDYQRGYRWTDIQIKNLLDDLEAFAEQEEQKTFFLEPIVVTKHGGPDCYELIDGQQRLTTLFLLGHILEKTFKPLNITPVKFNLIYPQSRGTLTFLQQIAAAPFADYWPGEDESADFYSIANACRGIRRQVEDSAKREKYIKILTGLSKNIKFLWHDTSEEKIPPSETFERLNTGKIALTDGELCRSLLLVRQDVKKELPSLKGFSEEEKRLLLARLSSSLVEKRRIIQANNWDEGERQLACEDFWEFLGNPTGYQTRMELVLNLHYNLRPGFPGDYVCFDKLYAATNSASKNDAKDGYAVWGEVKQTLQRLQDWYDDQDYYHWIGYLSRIDKRNLQELLKLSQNVTTTKFRDSVIDMIRESINIKDNDLDNVQYESGSNSVVWKILFLLNVEYARKRKLAFARFPFSKFTPAQSIEHVSARNLEAPKEISLRIEWLKDKKAFLDNLKLDASEEEVDAELEDDITTEISRDMPDGETSVEMSNREDLIKSLEKESLKLRSSIDTLLDGYSKVKKPAQAALLVEDFNQLYINFEEFMGRIEALEALEQVESLYNLCLIDKDINASFGNREFLGKQEKLRGILAKGEKYIPPATQALFMRHFMEKGFNCSWWTKNDRVAYRKLLHETLSLFWPEFTQNARGGNNG